VALPVGFYTVVARGEGRIHSRARCYQRRPRDDPRLGRMGSKTLRQFAHN
jgi:hypothetical protein